MANPFEIRLHDGRVALIDSTDAALVAPFKWYAIRCRGERFYAVAVDANLGTIRLHRFLLNPSRGQIVDHRDGNGLNCRRANLRICNYARNNENRRKAARTSSPYKGVTLHKRDGKYTSRIKVQGKELWLGSFGDEIDAALAYDAAARTHFGEFARLNFPINKEAGALTPAPFETILPPERKGSYA